MLDVLRKSAGGPVAKTLIGLLILSFGVWGVSGSILGGGGNSVVEVGDTKVGLLDFRLAYDNQINRLSQQMQTRLNREQARSLGLEDNVLAQMVSGAVLDENARKMGLGISEDGLAAIIGDDPNFQDASGNFSRRQLQLALQQIGMREEAYVENRKAVAIRAQIVSGTTGSLAMPKAFWKAYSDFQNEQRAFDYVLIGEEAVKNAPVLDSAEIAKFYEDNKQDHLAPEYRKLRIVKLEAEDITRPEDVSRDELNDAYEAGKASFITLEKRRIQQILFTSQEQAEDAASKLEAGTSFDSIVDSLGKTPDDIDIGLFEKPALPDQKVADTAFELALDTPSDVIEGIFGPVIIRIAEIQPQTTTPLAEVEDKLRQEIALVNANNEIFDTFDRIEDERAAGDSLVEAARKSGLSSRIIEAVDLNGLGIDGKPIASLPGSGELLRQAFETGVGVEADPVAIGDNSYIWYEVEKITPQRQKPLEEVRQAVEQAWIADKTTSIINDVAEQIAKRVRNGEDFNTVLGEQLPENSLGQPVITTRSDLVSRNTNDDNLSLAAIIAGFGAEQGSVLVTGAGDQTGRIILKISEIVNVTSETIDENIIQQLDAAAADDVLSQVVEDLLAREDVRVNRQAIEAALSF